MEKLSEGEDERGHHEGKEDADETSEMFLIVFVVGVPTMVFGRCHARPPESSCSVWM